MDLQVARQSLIEQARLNQIASQALQNAIETASVVGHGTAASVLPSIRQRRQKTAISPAWACTRSGAPTSLGGRRSAAARSRPQRSPATATFKDAAGTASAHLELQGGDFFNDALPVCDACLIMQVIHDWNDEESGRILKAIRRSAPAHAKLLLMKGILPGDSSASWMEMADIFMLALINGKQRTRSEFENLLTSSGLRLDKVIDGGLGTSILEASAT
jgi:hypothetical protein